VPAASTSEIVQSKLGSTLHLTGPKYAPMVLSRVNPLYPNTALDFGTQGLVKMSALISPAGDVVDVQIVEDCRTVSAKRRQPMEVRADYA
jgi:outer membrane biosynthesis protein TonB